MTHLTRDEVVALAEADHTPAGHHADTCAGCREDVLALRAVVRAARDVDIPEPSPLFWDHFSARVRRALDEPGVSVAPASTPAAVWSWRAIFASLSVAVVVGLLVVSRVPSPIPPAASTQARGGVPVPDAPALPAADEESGPDFEFVADVAGELVIGDAGDALDLGAPGAADTVLSGLSVEEEQELARLLRAELEKGRPS